MDNIDTLECPISHLNVTTLDLAIVLKNWKIYSQLHKIEDPRKIIKSFPTNLREDISQEFSDHHKYNINKHIIYRIFVDMVKSNLHKLEFETLETNYIHKKLIEHINETIDKKLIYFTSIDITIQQNEYLDNVHIPEIPESHLIETRLSAPPTPDQLDKFDLLEFEMKKGHFNEKEDTIIKSNWENFEKQYLREMDQEFIDAFYESKTIPVKPKIKFAQFIAQGLENRFLYNVYRRFIYLTKEYKSGRFSLSDNLIYSALMKRKIPVKLVSLILKRNYTSLFKKKYIGNTCSIKKNDNNLKCSLINVLLHITECKDIYDLANYTITYDQWKILESLFGISYIQLKKLWINSTKCYINKEIIDLNYLLKNVIERLHDSNCDNYKQIDWSHLTKEFHFNNRLFIWDRFLHLIYHHVPKIYWSNFKAVTNHLYEKRNTLFKRKKYLKQMFLNNDGDLIIKKPKL